MCLLSMNPPREFRCPFFVLSRLPRTSHIRFFECQRAGRPIFTFNPFQRAFEDSDGKPFLFHLHARFLKWTLFAPRFDWARLAEDEYRLVVFASSRRFAL